MARVELVFRSVGERTAGRSLELAKRFIRPERVHVIEHVRPFRDAVRAMLKIEHECDFVVHMDADCLIHEDLRPFLDWNDAPYVDCYVRDRFRGAIHCGVHITRIDIVRAMREVVPSDDDLAFVLRPESRTRNLALKGRSREKRFMGFNIQHDFEQSYASIWEKYALRELRSRVPLQRARLDAAMAHWGDEGDYRVARDAVSWARTHVGEGASADDVQKHIDGLAALSAARVSSLGLREKSALSNGPLPASAPRTPWPYKVFGLGLSRTGTRSLTAALHALGIHTVHYPVDATTLADLERGDGHFRLLEHFDGLTDITTVPHFEAIDRAYPGSKFILTTRPEDAWLDSARRHWAGRPAYGDPTKDETHLRVRRYLRMGTYGTHHFEPERFLAVRREHEARVRAYFAKRPDDLLVIPLTEGAGWRPLCEFLRLPQPIEPFPHKGGGGGVGRSLAEIHD
ncbi:MAG: sulfotransferase family protein [Myxococcota bacterium]